MTPQVNDTCAAAAHACRSQADRATSRSRWESQCSHTSSI